MDKPTIHALLKEAKKEYVKSKKEFFKYDNSDDMREMEAWDHVIEWLNGKLEQ